MARGMTTDLPSVKRKMVRSAAGIRKAPCLWTGRISDRPKNESVRYRPSLVSDLELDLTVDMAGGGRGCGVFICGWRWWEEEGRGECCAPRDIKTIFPREGRTIGIRNERVGNCRGATCGWVDETGQLPS